MEDEKSADIRKAAVRAVYGWDGRGLIGRDRASLTDRVYRAIEAERERCARVAEALIEERRGQSLSFDMIAAAIRATPVSEREEG